MVCADWYGLRFTIKAPPEQIHMAPIRVQKKLSEADRGMIMNSSDRNSYRDKRAIISFKDKTIGFRLAAKVLLINNLVNQRNMYKFLILFWLLLPELFRSTRHTSHRLYRWRYFSKELS